MNANKYFMRSTIETGDDLWHRMENLHETNASWLKEREVSPANVICEHQIILSCLHAVSGYYALVRPIVSASTMKSFKRTQFRSPFCCIDIIVLIAIQTSLQSKRVQMMLFLFQSLWVNRNWKVKKVRWSGFSKCWMAPWELQLKGCNFKFYIYKPIFVLPTTPLILMRFQQIVQLQ